tara:strand:+ start:693 stop:989 length:297 start_codon:yes stop_codon:yes gene_type:complete
MSWQEVVKNKKDEVKYGDDRTHYPPPPTEDAGKKVPSIAELMGGQRDARVEYINKELRKDVDKLVDILKESPANIFHDVRRDFQEILAKYEEYLHERN